MFSYIIGDLTEINEDVIVVENNGIGYEISIPSTVYNQLPSVGQRIKIYTYFYIREENIQLFGFLSKDMVAVFQLLLRVSGIGPKGALGILSAIGLEELQFAILSDDVKTIKKAPGIGTKTAQRLIIELKDKLKLEDMLPNNNNLIAESQPVQENIKNEAVQALTALGYSAADALRAVKQVSLTEGMTVEELLKAALKHISFL